MITSHMVESVESMLALKPIPKARIVFERAAFDQVKQALRDNSQGDQLPGIYGIPVDVQETRAEAFNLAYSHLRGDWDEIKLISVVHGSVFAITLEKKNLQFMGLQWDLPTNCEKHSEDLPIR